MQTSLQTSKKVLESLPPKDCYQSDTKIRPIVEKNLMLRRRKLIEAQRNNLMKNPRVKEDSRNKLILNQILSQKQRQVETAFQNPEYGISRGDMDYIRYHNKLDLKYCTEGPEDDGFQFRRKEERLRRPKVFAREFEKEVSPSSSEHTSPRL
jgi:hypothetical protein